ncbi:MAG: hypothetical protein LBH70_00500 [Spirochaetaceae bacterium]|nr:hypothetical protein [Spirochaetaceae bacterium]
MDASGLRPEEGPLPARGNVTKWKSVPFERRRAAVSLTRVSKTPESRGAAEIPGSEF